MDNPFNITKAVDYTDEELNKYWVDFPLDTGFKGIIKPTSDMPMIILGSKGSGKTHIMKHFSFTMQSLRWKEDIINGLTEDGYIGVYLRCSGLNGFKFNGRGESDEAWQTIFAYYLELWLSQLLLNNIVKILEKNNITKNNEHILCLKILELLDIPSPPNLKGFTHIIKYFNELQKEIDYAINNRAFTNKKISDSIQILASPGSLIFGIPSVLSENVIEFSNLKFLYLLDEYENFTSNQQKYFNTLIRERKNPTCFKIGARRYGIRTYQTLSAGEDIKSGSEYEEFDIDNIFRKYKKDYNEFMKNICIKRLNFINVNIEANELNEYFENADTQELLSKVASKGRKHLKHLTTQLSKSHSKENIDQILKNIRYSKDIFLERINLLLFYREWNNGRNLIEASSLIKDSCLEYVKDKNISNRHSQAIDKHKNDIIDVLYRENSLKVETYAGFDNLVKISNGIPRHFLIIMKHIFRWNDFYENKVFQNKENKISILTQLNALADTANWFIEDSRHPGKDGNLITESLTRLCDYLRELRYSNIPPECNISTFSIQPRVIPKEISSIIEFLEQYSYVIKLNTGRRDKNFNARNISYQINGLLASQWELAIGRRCIVDLDINEIKCIFFPEKEDEYKNMLINAKRKYNAPFQQPAKTMSLFD